MWAPEASVRSITGYLEAELLPFALDTPDYGSLELLRVGERVSLGAAAPRMPYEAGQAELPPGPGVPGLEGGDMTQGGSPVLG